MGLDLVEMVLEVEKQFQFDIPDADAERLLTVGLLYDYIVTHAPGLPPDAVPNRYEGAAWDRYIGVVEREVGIEARRLVPSARWVQDLDLD